MTKQTALEPLVASLQKKPIALAVRDKLLNCQTAPALASAMMMATPAAFGQQATEATGGGALEEVLVTAQKRVESLQEVPLSIQVLDTGRLQELNIDSFDSYIQYMPNVSYWSKKPGEASIYIRGISDGGDGNASGSAPSVAVYVDEQPVTSIGRNLDVHIYDIARIEVLAGPQGTLYGANSQAGNLRIITNKPNPDGFEAGFDVGSYSVSKGDPGYSAEAFANIPLSDNSAVRLVGWWVEDGGYIDNVSGSKTFVLPDGAFSQVVGGSDITVDNSAIAKDDINEATNTGARAALRFDLNESWTLNASIFRQKQETEGVWDHDPEDVGDLQVIRFFEDESTDEWTQYGLTIEGEVGDGMNLTYSGSYLDRDVFYQIDYSEYADYYTSGGFVEAYYTCYYVYYYACDDPRIRFTEDNKYKRNTHELRLRSDQNQRLRWIAGMFYETDEHKYDQEWHIPAMTSGLQIDDPDIYFTTDQIREDNETAFFGELSYDFSEQLTGTFGVRFFDHDTILNGFVGTVWWPNCCFNRDDNVNVRHSESDNTFKFNLSYAIDEDKMIYGTVSEGYRPGGANRLVIDIIGATYDADFVTNYEFGWKTMLKNDRVRFNGAVYLQEWDDFQFTRFDSSVSLLGLTNNIGQAESIGFEGDITWLATDDWELSAAWSWNNAEMTEDYFLRPGGSVTAPDGTELPLVPDLKYTLSARHSFNIGDKEAYLQGVFSYTDDSYNDIVVAARALQDSYNILNLSFGIAREGWGLDFYANNVTDERAEIYINAVDWDTRVTTNRPRSFGAKFRKRF